MNLPNLLTLLRLFLVPIFIITFFSTLENRMLISVLVFLVAGITDVFDGYIARRFNLITKWGQVVDPFADKIMQLTVLTCFTIDKYLPVWLIVIYGAKELTMIFGGIFLYTKKEKVVIPANSYGKVATIIFYLAVISVALQNEYSYYVFIVAIFFALLAFIQYSVIGSNKLKQIKNSNK